MPIRLLCIDDDRPTQDLLQTLAEDEGWQHLPVLHPDRAFALVDSAAPDVILLDLMLPGVADVGELAARLRAHFGADDAFINEWCRHWIATGFDGIEAVLASDPRTGRFCYGDAPGFADIFLIPQTVNAVNFGVDMTAYPTIQRVFDACMALPAFAQSHPKAQPDAE